MFSGQKILVAGASGLSGRAAAKLLFRLGAIVYLSDSKISGDDFSPEFHDRRGSDSPEILDSEDFSAVVTAPGVPLAGAFLQEVVKRKIPLLGENDLGFRILRDISRPVFPFVAITGTDGKSTTTALLAHLISCCLHRHALACGNYGTPLSAIALDLFDGVLDPATVLVVELSSFQLELVGEFRSPIAMILNLAADHMDRYDSIESYLKAKLHIMKNALPGDFLLLPENLQAQIAPDDIEKIGANSVQLCRPVTGLLDAWPDLPALRGNHNRQNALFALAALEKLSLQLGATIMNQELIQALHSFPGLPHRLEEVARQGSLLFVNDSKATTLQAVESALAACRGQVFLLLGGRNKGLDFSSLRGKARIYPYGEAGPILQNQVQADTSYRTMADAFHAALLDGRQFSGAATILLSPGCASFDEFSSYADRGEKFRALVLNAIEEKGI